jgi:hypothetical protein
MAHLMDTFRYSNKYAKKGGFSLWTRFLMQQQRYSAIRLRVKRAKNVPERNVVG